jgi:hypothetical protein
MSRVKADSVREIYSEENRLLEKTGAVTSALSQAYLDEIAELKRNSRETRDLLQRRLDVTNIKLESTKEALAAEQAISAHRGRHLANLIRIARELAVPRTFGRNGESYGSDEEEDKDPPPRFRMPPSFESYSSASEYSTEYEDSPPLFETLPADPGTAGEERKNLKSLLKETSDISRSDPFKFLSQRCRLRRPRVHHSRYRAPTPKLPPAPVPAPVDPAEEERRRGEEAERERVRESLRQQRAEEESRVLAALAAERERRAKQEQKQQEQLDRLASLVDADIAVPPLEAEAPQGELVVFDVKQPPPKRKGRYTAEQEFLSSLPEVLRSDNARAQAVLGRGPEGAQAAARAFADPVLQKASQAFSALEAALLSQPPPRAKAGGPAQEPSGDGPGVINLNGIVLDARHAMTEAIGDVLAASVKKVDNVEKAKRARERLRGTRPNLTAALRESKQQQDPGPEQLAGGVQGGSFNLKRRGAPVVPPDPAGRLLAWANDENGDAADNEQFVPSKEDLQSAPVLSGRSILPYKIEDDNGEGVRAVTLDQGSVWGHQDELQGGLEQMSIRR